MKLLNGMDYDRWSLLVAGFGMPDPDTMEIAKRQRKPLDEAYKDKRQAHMKRLFDSGAPYSWIARLYDLNRSQVYRIINNLPNHL